MKFLAFATKINGVQKIAEEVKIVFMKAFEQWYWLSWNFDSDKNLKIKIDKENRIYIIFIPK